MIAVLSIRFRQLICYFLGHRVIKQLTLTHELLVCARCYAEPFGTLVEFPGFDGNHEPHYHIAEYIINDMRHRFEYFKGRNMNSHSQSVPGYRRMYRVFERMRANLHSRRNLTLAELTEILKARMHPDFA